MVPGLWPAAKNSLTALVWPTRAPGSTSSTEMPPTCPSKIARKAESPPSSRCPAIFSTASPNRSSWRHMSVTALLVDDEPLAREGLRILLARDPEVSAIHEARDGHEAVEAIRSLRPDIVFLDVQMPGMDGFAVVQELGVEAMPAVVFVTAHDKYAIQAFELNAFDYLLKPVTEERFAKALASSKARLRSNPVDNPGSRILSLLETMASPRHFPRRLAIRSAGKTIFVDVA